MANKTIVDLETDLVKPYIDSVKSQLSVGGSINLAPNNLVTTTNNDITWTKNSDGTVTANGTASANTTVNFTKQADNWYLPAGTYKVTGCPSGGSSSKYFIRVYNVDSSATEIARDYGSGDTFTLAARTRVSMTVSIISGQAVSNLVFKPMVTVSTYSSDYVPYAMTNHALTKNKVGWDSQKNFGSVNMIPNKATTSVVKGITYTVNEDGSVDVSGTNDGTGNSNLAIVTDVNAYVPNGTYKVKGCPKGGSENSYSLYTRDAHNHIVYDTGDGVVADLPYSTNSTALNIRIASGYAIQGTLHFEPMICSLDYEGDYVPYAATNEQLTRKMPTLDNVNKGTFDIPRHLIVTSQASYSIPDFYGVHLLIITSVDSDPAVAASRSGVYLIQCHSSSGSYTILPIFAVTDSSFSISMDKSTKTLTFGFSDSVGGAYRIITLQDANY